MLPRFSSLSIAAAAFLLAAPAARAAPPRTFDITQFAPPDGFAVDDKSADHVSMTDTAPGRFGVIAVYTGRPASGDLTADFKTQWHDAVEHMMQPDATPEPVRGTMPGGAALLVGSSTAKMDGKEVYARLFVVDGGAKVASVLVVTPGADIYDRYEDVVNTMLAGMTITKTVVPSGPGAGSGSGTGSGTGTGSAKVKPPAPPAPPAIVPVALPEDPALPAAPKVDKKQLLGEWQHSTGRAADKDSAIYGDLYTLTSKGKFEYRFIGRTGTNVLREDDGGGFAYKDGRLLLLGNKRGTFIFRVAGWQSDKAATTLTLLPDGFPATQGNATIFAQSWARPKKHGRAKR